MPAKRLLDNSTSLGKTFTRLKHRSCQRPIFSSGKQADTLNFSANIPHEQFSSKYNSNTKMAKMFNRISSMCRETKLPKDIIAIRSAIPQELPTKVKAEENHGEDIKETIIRKNVELTILFRKMHNFMINVADLKWMVNESCSLVGEYKSIVHRPSRFPSHFAQVSNIKKQLDALARRFAEIDDQIGDSNEIHFTEDYVENVKSSQPQQLNFLRDKENNPNVCNVSAQFEHISLLKPKDEKAEKNIQMMREELEQTQQGLRKRQTQIEGYIRQIETYRRKMQTLGLWNMRYRTVMCKNEEYIEKCLRSMGDRVKDERVRSELRLIGKQLRGAFAWSEGELEVEPDQKSKQIQEIIGLQYDISALRTTKQFLAGEPGEEHLRLLLTQAATLQEVLRV